jgi:Fur family ferric uptake transcriptional regulator
MPSFSTWDSSNFNQVVKKQLLLCRENGLRITSTLKETLNLLENAAVPMSLAELEEKITSCNQSTIYRSVQRLKKIGVVKQLNFAEQGTKFALATREDNDDFLICKACGKVEALDSPSPLNDLKNRLMQKTGFSGLSHELEFYGVCPQCV